MPYLSACCVAREAAEISIELHGYGLLSPPTNVASNSTSGARSPANASKGRSSSAPPFGPHIRVTGPESSVKSLVQRAIQNEIDDATKIETQEEVMKHGAHRNDLKGTDLERFELYSKYMKYLCRLDAEFYWDRLKHEVVGGAESWATMSKEERKNLINIGNLPLDDFKYWHDHYGHGGLFREICLDMPQFMELQYVDKLDYVLRKAGVPIPQGLHHRRATYRRLFDGGMNVFYLLQQVIQVGHLGWHAKTKMLVGEEEAWAKHPESCIQIWKGRPFPDFDSWRWILNEHVCIADHSPYLYFLAPFFGEKCAFPNPKIAKKEAPWVFGDIKNYQAARRLYAIHAFYRQTNAILVVLTREGFTWDTKEKRIVASESDWTALILEGNSYTREYYNRSFPRFEHGAYYFAPMIARSWERKRTKWCDAHGCTTHPHGASGPPAPVKNSKYQKKPQAYVATTTTTDHAQPKVCEQDKARQKRREREENKKKEADKEKGNDDCKDCASCLRREANYKDMLDRPHAGLPTTQQAVWEASLKTLDSVWKELDEELEPFWGERKRIKHGGDNSSAKSQRGDKPFLNVGVSAKVRGAQRPSSAVPALSSLSKPEADHEDNTHDTSGRKIPFLKWLSKK